MASFISHLTVDCADAYSLAQWWKPVLGYEDVPDDPNLPGHEECMIVDPDGKGTPVLFIEVPEGKSVKNRLHLDLRPRAERRDTEIERLIAHGATVVGDHRGKYGPGSGWVTLADPEGNEFCVLRSQAEVGEQPTPAAVESDADVEADAEADAATEAATEADADTEADAGAGADVAADKA